MNMASFLAHSEAPSAIDPIPILALLVVLLLPAIALIATIVHTNRCIKDARGNTPGLGQITLQEELWRFLDELEHAELAYAGSPAPEESSRSVAPEPPRTAESA